MTCQKKLFNCYVKINSVELQEDQKKALSNLIGNEIPYCGIVKHVRGRHPAYQPKEAPLSTPEENAAIKTIFLLQDYPLMEEVKQQKFGPLNSSCEESISRLQGNFVEICEKTKAYYDEWMNHRSVRITGSTCYGLYTYIRNKNPDWDKKFEDVFHPKNFKSIYTEYGKVTEEKARKSYVTVTNNEVLCSGLIVSACNPWLAYSPDGVIFKNNKPIIKLLEIKCPFIGKKSNISETVMNCIGKCLQATDEDIYLKEKHSNYGQVQLGVAVINVEVADFVIYSAADDKMFIIQVKRNNIFIGKMLRALKKLYFEKIVHFTCLKNKK